MAITSSIPRQTCWIAILQRINRTRNVRVPLVTFLRNALPGDGHQLCLDASRLAVSRCDPRFAFAAGHRLTREQPDETRSGDPGAEDGNGVLLTTQRLHSPDGPWVLMIISRSCASMASKPPSAAKAIAKIVNMVLRLDGLTHATIDFVSLR